jgi:3-deoxy-manno-octulosonate cytidylyltransferase (CMP-KDO synthetase)
VIALNPIILIPARLGSTRLPNKMLADIAGRPMIAHVLQQALAAALGPVVVACAEPAIAAAVTEAGGRAVLTDPALPSGSDRIAAALAIIDPSSAYDTVINLQGDFPTVQPADIEAALAPLRAGFDIGSLVTPITTAEEAGAPSVVKCACAFAPGEEVAREKYSARATIPANQGPLWHHVGIYAYRRAALARFIALPPAALELREQLEQLRALGAGMSIGVARIAAGPRGIDTPEDLAALRAAMGPGT